MKTIAVNNASRLFGTAGVYFGVEGPSRPLLPVSFGIRWGEVLVTTKFGETPSRG